MGGIKQNLRLRNFMNGDTPRTNAQLLSSDCAYNCGHYFSLRRAQKWVNGKCVESRENVAHGNDGVVVLADFAFKLERENIRLREAGGLMRAWIGNDEKTITERWDAAFPNA
jgi:hypothetical protein